MVKATAGGMFTVGGACVKCRSARSASRRSFSAPASASSAAADNIGMARRVFTGFT